MTQLCFQIVAIPTVYFDKTTSTLQILSIFIDFYIRSIGISLKMAGKKRKNTGASKCPGKSCKNARTEGNSQIRSRSNVTKLRSQNPDTCVTRSKAYSDQDQLQQTVRPGINNNAAPVANSDDSSNTITPVPVVLRSPRSPRPPKGQLGHNQTMLPVQLNEGDHDEDIFADGVRVNVSPLEEAEFDTDIEANSAYEGKAPRGFPNKFRSVAKKIVDSEVTLNFVRGQPVSHQTSYIADEADQEDDLEELDSDTET